MVFNNGLMFLRVLLPAYLSVLDNGPLNGCCCVVMLETIAVTTININNKTINILLRCTMPVVTTESGR